MDKERLEEAQFWLRAGIAAVHRWPALQEATIVQAPEDCASFLAPVYVGPYSFDHERVELEKYADKDSHQIRMGYEERSRTLVVYIGDNPEQ